MTADGVRALYEAREPRSGLPSLFLRVPEEGESAALRVVATLVKLRAGGFMVAIPECEEAIHLLQAQELDDGAEAVALFPTTVVMETTRGRVLGEEQVILADVAWPTVHLFSRANPLRSSSLPEVVRFLCAGQPARPQKASLEAAAEQWIHEAMDEDTAADYVTVQGDEQAVEPELVPDESLVEDLQQRVRDLENMLAQQSRASAPQVAPGSTSQRVQPRGVLFGDQTPEPADKGQTLATLRQMAGAAPNRLGAHERAVREGRPEQFIENLQQEATLEAVAPPELEDGLDELEALTTDPMQRMLVLQMKHLRLLSKQQAERKVDPLHAALGGSETSSGGSGIKGCLARDAYVRLAADVAKVGGVVLQNAAVELGLDPHQVGSGMMREYLEKRCPLGDHRLLTQVGYLFAAAWEHGFKTNNPDLLGHASRGMLFVDQAATDFGRTNLAWLLTSLPEPQYSITQRNRTRNSISPFTRLAHASWVAANVSYMKDLDYLEGRIKSTNTSAAPSGNAKTEAEDGAAAKKQPWKKKKGKQKDDGPAGAQES